MENKLNIAELLKDCPKGMELDCTMFDDVTFINVEENVKPICIRTGDIYHYLTKFGTCNFNENAKCVIFPKGKTTWEGFQKPFEDGDILISGLEDNPFIFKRINGLGNAQCYCAISCFGQLILNNDNWTCIKGCRLATEEEKEKLFQAIKDNGYKWNFETKTLEKLVESNEDVDDKIVMSGIYFDRENYADEVELHLGNYEIEIRDGKTYAIFKNQKTETLNPKFKVGDRIKEKQSNIIGEIIDVQKNKYNVRIDDKGLYLYFREQDNWELGPNKFDISTLVPFESKVLVRNKYDDFWEPAIFGVFYAKEHAFKFCIVGSRRFKECIPYEGNEHLLGTTDDCDDYHKTWE